ncbi:GGDEF domain-containing protein [Shewanella canadensis]|uniref:diguanylate cyclase n=1 Tax=Shewanella canadensis TaxID=271096 RepID=A0A431WTE0_9GAMM|nr:GGDEF domain-containing protein [Shewanella canadensis]RTR38882.1 GGDEF domain-containing protein [Shewanella canadensis]
MSFFRSSLFKIGFPILLAILVYLPNEQLFTLLATYQELLNALPYVLLTLVLFLSQPFNQGSTGLVSLLMLLGYYVTQNWLSLPIANDTDRITFVLFATLLPLNILLIHLLPEKRILSRFGAAYCGFILLQFLWVYIALGQLALMDISWLWQSFIKPLPTISPAPLVVIILAFLLTLISALLLLFRGNNYEQSIFIALLFSSVLVLSFYQPLMPELCFSLAAAVLLITIIDSSHELAFIDQLTELPGRRALEIEITNLSGLYTIAMIDIDHFKHFNDTYGHRTGDEVLRLVAQLMSKNKGKGKLFRYGGEEFTVLFKGKNANQCMPYFNSLRTRVAEYDLKLRNYKSRPIRGGGVVLKMKPEQVEEESVSITVSIGVADSLSELSPENVIQAADKALYRAKNSGRNKVTNLRFA